MPARHLPALLLLALLAPLGQAGTSDAPEITDTEDDGVLGHLDIRSLWVDTNDTQNLTFHLTLGAELPSIARPTSQCNGADCAFTSLSFRILFRPLGPDGRPLPTTPEYNRSYVAYRHGPNGTLASPVGTYDDANVLTLNGTANVTLDGSEVVLRVPRSSPAVNMPLGPQPGTRIERLYAFDSPQACTPAAEVSCLPLLRLVVNTTTTPPTATQVSEWDRAPNEGFASAVFPAPPPAAPAAPTPTPAPAPAPQPAPDSAPEPEPEAETVVPPQPQVDGQDQGRRESPGLASSAVLAILALALLVLRRR